MENSDTVLGSYQTLPLINLQQLKIKPVKTITSQEYLSTIDSNIKPTWKYVYLFKLTYQSQAWEIRRHFAQFQQLAKQMKQQFHIKQSADNILLSLQEFLDYILQLSYVKVYPPTFLLEFLELTYVQYEHSQKVKECYIQKKKGNQFKDPTCLDKIFCCSQNWDRRYFYITTESIYYSKGSELSNCAPRDFIYFDYNFSILYGYQQTGHQYGIKIITSTKYFQLQAEDLFSYCDFLYSLKIAIQKSEYTKIHRFDSFSKIQRGKAQWFIDSEDYYRQLYDSLLKARETLYIMSNRMNPDIYLKRPRNQNKQSKLDITLKYIADKGVNIYIKLQNNENEVQSRLQRLSQNIKVNINPYHNQPFQWEHNERLIIIDNQKAYLGSLDLDLEVLDTQSHSDQLGESIYEDISQFNGNRRQLFHDVQVEIQGLTVHDFSRHFVQSWNYSVQIQNQQGNFIENNRNFDNPYFENECNNHHFHAYLKKLELEVSQDHQKSEESKDNQSSFQQSVYESERDSDQIQLNQNDKSERQQLSQVYVQEQNDLSSCKQYLEVASFLAKSQSQGLTNSQMKYSEIQKSKVQVNHIPMICIPKMKLIQQFDSSCQLQGIRSVSSWSIGCLNKEFSIQLGYLQSILQSKFLIYIENPVLISSCGGHYIENQIGNALVKRIIQAYQNRQKFKVILMISESEEQQHYYTMETLVKDQNSIIQQLKKQMEDPFEYLNIFSLQKFKVNSDNSSQFDRIQINSRLMIVDDEIAIIGSAMINDRSQMGDRNSELCVVIEDDEKIPTLMNGESSYRSKFSHTLRTQLYQEHFNVDYQQVADPLNKFINEKIREQASINLQLWKSMQQNKEEMDIKVEGNAMLYDCSVNSKLEMQSTFPTSYYT